MPWMMVSLRLGVDVRPEGRVFLGEPVEGLGHAVGGFVVLGRDGQGDDRLGDVASRSWRRLRPGLQKVSPEAQSTPNRATMSPQSALGDVLHRVGVHADEAADLDLLAASGC